VLHAPPPAIDEICKAGTKIRSLRLGHFHFAEMENNNFSIILNRLAKNCSALFKHLNTFFEQYEHFFEQYITEGEGDSYGP